MKMSGKVIGQWTLGVVLAVGGIDEVQAQRYTQLCSFGSPDSIGVELSSKLIEGSDGALYGTTRLTYEGVSSVSMRHGVIYRVNKDGSGYKVIKIFGTHTNEGGLLSGGLVETREGELFGVTQMSSWPVSGGTIYKLNRDGTGFTYLRYLGLPGEGYQPQGPPIQGSDGAIYGTTLFGLPPGIYDNSQPQGTVWRINPDGTGFTVLHYFASAYPGGGNGSRPVGRIIEGSDGWLYGTTEQGGLGHLGTVYRLARDGSQFEIIKHFGTNPNETYSPGFGVIESPDGGLYGIAAGTGTNVVYRLERDGSNFTIVRSFGSAIRLRDLIFASDGVLNGTDSSRVFRFPAPGITQFLVEGIAGGVLGVTEGSDGTLYMAVAQGGSRRFGAILKVNENGIGSSVVREFRSSRPDGANHRRIVDGRDGFLYGTSWEGGLQASGGTVWKVSRNGGALQVLHHFVGLTNGFRPWALLVGSDGLLYGMTEYGGPRGPSGGGVVFRLGRDGSQFQVIYNFTNAHLPRSEFMEGADGSLYGGSWYDDTTTNAAFFKISKDGSGFRIIHTFDTTSDVFSLFPAQDGTWVGLYAASRLFRFDSSTDTYETITNFPYMGWDAHFPITVLEDDDGLFYGGGSQRGRGTVYRMRPDGTDVTVLWSEDYPRVRPDVVEGPDGLLYFTQPQSDAFEGIGSLWRIRKDGSGLTQVHRFPTGHNDGITPKYITKGSDGAIYGVTLEGGVAHGGTVFRLDWPLLAPSNLLAVANSGTQVQLSWVNIDARAAAVRIERKVEPEPTWIELAIVGGQANAFTDNTAAPGQTIVYRVRASNPEENSDYSNEAVVVTPQLETRVVFVSVGSEDGFVVERHQRANVGGLAVASLRGPTGLSAGDASGNQQLKAIVSFRTGSLPSGATILSARLRLKRGIVYGNPFSALGTCNVDMEGPSGLSGSSRLQREDFQDVPALAKVATIPAEVDNAGWHTAVLNGDALTQLARGHCQFRIYFARSDDKDHRYDFVGWHPGEAMRVENRPLLEIVYR